MAYHLGKQATWEELVQNPAKQNAAKIGKFNIKDGSLHFAPQEQNRDVAAIQLAASNSPLDCCI